MATKSKRERFVKLTLLSLAVAFAHGWALMLVIGMLHDEWWPSIPTIGYWWAVTSVALLRALIAHPDWPLCTAGCGWPLAPAAAAGGFTTHPACDLPTPPRGER